MHNTHGVAAVYLDITGHWTIPAFDVVVAKSNQTEHNQHNRHRCGNHNDFERNSDHRTLKEQTNGTSVVHNAARP